MLTLMPVSMKVSLAFCLNAHTLAHFIQFFLFYTNTHKCTVYCVSCTIPCFARRFAPVKVCTYVLYVQ